MEAARRRRRRMVMARVMWVALPVAVARAFAMNGEDEADCVATSSEWSARDGREREWTFRDGKRYVWRDSAPEDVEVVTS